MLRHVTMTHSVAPSTPSFLVIAKIRKLRIHPLFISHAINKTSPNCAHCVMRTWIALKTKANSLSAWAMAHIHTQKKEREKKYWARLKWKLQLWRASEEKNRNRGLCPIVLRCCWRCCCRSWLICTSYGPRAHCIVSFCLPVTLAAEQSSCDFFSAFFSLSLLFYLSATAFTCIVLSKLYNAAALLCANSFHQKHYSQ